MMDHEYYIRRCFFLAKKALGQTSPNPYVGSLIVKENKILAEGYHAKAGRDHAELDAISKLNADELFGSTLYCNLEPCCHTNKKTAPCAQKIIQVGIKKVIISNLDPNPKVAGKGIQLLKNSGIEVITGILEDEGALLNEVFFYHILNKKPFVHLKWAQTLDGKIATLSGDSKWISNAKARHYVHQERNLYDAILIGANTANADNPLLTVRLNNNKKIRRIVLSPKDSLREDLNLLNDHNLKQTLLITENNSKYSHKVDNLVLPLTSSNEVDLEKLLTKLYELEIYSLYVEGGSQVLSYFLQKKIYNRLSITIAPKLLGDGLTPLFKKLPKIMKEALEFENPNWKIFDQNVLLESKRNICLQDL